MLKNDILIKKYYEEHSFVESNMSSFNRFIETDIQKIIDEMGEITPTITPQETENFKIKFEKIIINKPQLVEADGSKRDIFPSEARLRKLTYAAPIELEISTNIDDVQREKFITDVGFLPIMVKSKFCHLHNLKEEELIKEGEDPYDLGGYFILDGNERVLITVEDLAPNKIFFQKNKTGPSKYTAKVYSENGPYRIPHTIEQMKDGLLYISFTRFKRIPIIAVIKALGLVKDQEITSFISEEFSESLFINLYNSIDLKTEDDALELLAKRIGITQPKDVRIEKTKENLDRYLLPHIGIKPKDRIYKAYNLCKIIKRFFILLKQNVTSTDKDHHMNQKLKLSGDLLADLFRINLRILVNDILYNFQRLVKRGKFTSIKILIRDKLLTSRIQSAMATGSWVGDRKGVSQNIDRINYLATISHLQRVVSLLSTTQENFEARALHPTHWGRLCVQKEAEILMSDRITQLPIKDFVNDWKNKEILTYDKNKDHYVPSTLCAYYMFNPPKPTVKIETESGRNIICTVDHPFLSENKKWKEAGILKKEDKLAIYPTLEKASTKCKKITIINEKNLKKYYPHNATRIIKKLRAKKLFPLTTKDERLPILSRIFGFLLTDGYLGKCHMDFYFGSEEDRESFKKDIISLNIQPGKERKDEGEIEISGKKINRRIFVLEHKAELRSLMIILGMPLGRKTDTNFKIPKWLFNSSQLVKREFLAGLLGGDGPKPRYVIRKNRISSSKVHLDPFILHKREDKIGEGLEYVKDLERLFNKFNIKLNKVKIEEGYKRKNGSSTKKIKVKFSNSRRNIYNITNKIGYRYCKEKQVASSIIGEYLKIRENKVKKRKEIKQKIIDLKEKNYTTKEISQILKIKQKFVQTVLERKNKYKRTYGARTLIPPIHIWYNKSVDNSIVWEKITDIIPVKCKDVRDFTTRKESHSFIANGFITHNCAIETPEGTSIGLRKNLALLCEISQKEINEEKLKKILESFKLNLIK